MPRPAALIGALVAETLTFFPVASIQKIESDPDDPDAVIVSGLATTGELDSDRQIVDPDWARGAMREWFDSYANVRQMHQAKAAGKAISLEDQGGGQYISARIVEPTAVKLCREGVYSAFSIGISHPVIKRDMQAPNGRICGGTVAEVSVVDRPSNPSAKFMMAKGSGLDIEDVAEVITIEAATSEENALVGDAPGDVTKKAYSDDERASMAKEGNALPDGSYPIANKADLKNAISSFGRAKDPDTVKSHIIARAKALDATDLLPADWAGSTKPKSTKSGQPDFTATRLHDIFCPAYDLDDVVAEYPSVQKNGVAASLGPLAMQSIYQMLLNEVGEDGGMGKCAADIDHIASAYFKVCQFLYNEAQEDANGDKPEIDPASILAAARSDLHKRFREVNDLKKADSPKPAETPTPGQYKRPYIAAGRQRENGVSTSGNSVPETARVIDASQFDRGLITTGHEANSPANKAGGRTFYTNDAKGETQDVLQAVHDSLLAIYPGMCPMGHTVAEQAPAEPAVASVPNSDDAAPKAIAPSAQDAATVAIKANKAEKKAMKKLLKKMAGEMGQMRDQHKAEMAEVTDRLNKLASSPDPAQSPFRGGGSLDVVTKAAATEAQKRVPEADDDRRAFLERVGMSGMPARHAALEASLKD